MMPAPASVGPDRPHIYCLSGAFFGRLAVNFVNFA